MTTSLTRQSFQDSLEELRAQPLIGDLRPPAFMQPLGVAGGRGRPELAALPAGRLRPARPHLTIGGAQELMAAGALSSVELLHAALAAIHARDGELNAFVYVAPAEALLAEARQRDDERRRGIVRGPLHGVPVSVKDVIPVADMPSTASSALLASAVAAEDALSVARLRQAGAIIVGKTQTHEFALGVTTPQSRNPHDASRDPGGSSGGSAISVATGMSLASLGTDTRASIRVPSALCGTVGYKPTFGLVPTAGVLTLSWSLDHVGPICQTVEDAALMFDALIDGGFDARGALARDVRGMRVGVPVSALASAEPGVLAAFGASMAALESLGVEVVEVDAPGAAEFDLAVSLGLIISRCEAASAHRAYGDLHANRAGYTRQVYEQLDEASQVLAVDYLHAQRCRADIRERVLRAMGGFDAFLTPTCLVTAPKSADVERYFLVLSQNCILWSFIGVPAISVPCGRSAEGLPVGAQLAAAPYEDARLLALAAALEGALV
jgi:aspartyl-tRNA(Asn)/glutamyl-tRNA(Gln) amidotransferase subunit A